MRSRSVSGHSLEEWRLGLTVLPLRPMLDHNIEEITGQLDPPRPPRLGYRRSNEPRAAGLVEIPDPSCVELADASTRGVQHQESDDVRHRQKPCDRLDVRRARPLGLFGLLARELYLHAISERGSASRPRSRAPSQAQSRSCEWTRAPSLSASSFPTRATTSAAVSESIDRSPSAGSRRPSAVRCWIAVDSRTSTTPTPKASCSVATVGPREARLQLC
jgi:hypothetical protein